MGSLGVKFSPLNPTLPIQVFLSIVEHEGNTKGLSETDMVALAVRHLDVPPSSAFKSITQWPELKALLIKSYGHEEAVVGTEQKLVLLSSLSKGPTENCYHFLLKVKHAVAQIVGPEEWTQLLFLLGLSYDERAMFDPSHLPSLHQICSTINALMETVVKAEEDEEDLSKMESHDVKSVPFIDEGILEVKTKEEEKVEGKVDVVEMDLHSSGGGCSDSEAENTPLSRTKKSSPPMAAKKKKPSAAKKDPRSCSECSFTADTRAELDAHVQKMHRKTVVCTICKAQVRSKSYKRHLKESHGGMEHKCEECGELLPSVPKLNHHMKKFHGEGYKRLLERAERGEIYIEKNPEQIPPIKSLEPIVIRPSNPNEKLRTRCNLCPGEPEFEGAATFVQHYKTVHNGTRFGCDMCPYLANDLKRVHDHRLVIHNMAWGGKPIYHCKIEECKFKTIDYYVFVDHLEVRHDTTEKTWECAICDKKYATKSRLKTHTNVVHLNMKKHQCPQCDYSTTGAKQLQLHMDIHRDLNQKTSRVVCEECGGVYNCQGSLNQHVKRIHRREKNHECPDCPGKMFFTRVQLKKHQEDIHLERTHFCSHCNKAFARVSRLQKHIEIAHLQIKRFRCKICNQYFSESSNLCYHVGRKHMNFTDEEAKSKRNLARQHEAFEKLDEGQITRQQVQQNNSL